MLEICSAAASVRVEPAAGGRIAQLTVDGLDLLVGPEDDPLRWGCYPMVPFAGRVRRGRFVFDGREYVLPRNLPPHAIHGFGLSSTWTVESERCISTRLSEPWPFPAQVVQEFDLSDSGLVMRMSLHAEVRQPATLGWHPWFRRDIGSGETVVLEFEATAMYELDHEAIPTGRLVDPTPPPWDNCFTSLKRGPNLRWGERLSVELASSADHWVVYDQPDHAVCVEPQTAPPNSLHLPQVVVEAGQTAFVTMNIDWGQRP